MTVWCAAARKVITGGTGRFSRWRGRNSAQWSGRRRGGNVAGYGTMQSRQIHRPSTRKITCPTVTQWPQDMMLDFLAFRAQMSLTALTPRLYPECDGR